MCFRMGRARRGFGTASTALRWRLRGSEEEADPYGMTTKGKATRKAPAAGWRRLGLFLGLRSLGLAFDDLAGLDAAGADAHALAAAIDLGLDGLQVDVPAATGGVV